ncbi:MAG: site-2 protease family protein [Desulfobacterota bacterium]|jgi:Zn-dependent protease|nr:site-2 protease family protein [Thermodesulfobacteriota bacterium]
MYKACAMDQMNQILSQIALLIVPVLFSITVHEVCHGYAAYLFGDPTAKMAGRLTFNPIKHIDPIGLLVLFVTRMIGWAKPVPVDPRYFKRPRQDMVWVSLAGPASNLVLAALTALVLRFIGPVLAPTPLYPLVVMGQMMVVINVGLAIFNLIPIHPLDGSHIMEGLLPAGLAYSYSKLQPYGFIILLLLIFTKVVDIVIAPIINGIVYVLLS